MILRERLFVAYICFLLGILTVGMLLTDWPSFLKLINKSKS